VASSFADAAPVRAGILRALAADHGGVPDGLSYFSFERFLERWHGVLRGVFGPPAPAAVRPYDTASSMTAS
jgi:hypothetical protein